MKRLLLLVVSGFLLGQTPSTPTYQVPIWNPTVKRYQYFTLGTGLSIAGSQLTVTCPAVPTRFYEVSISYDSTIKGWKLPDGARNVVVYAGIRLFRGVDYNITNGYVMTVDTLPLSCPLTVDYDQ